MGRDDLPIAASYTAAEGWVSEDLATFKGFYQHDPAGCLLARLDGQPVGIGIATSYGESGFIGELIVHPDYRGRGIGATMLKHAINYLHRRGAMTIYLDGVPNAVPLYERYGFRKVCRSLRFTGKTNSVPHTTVRPLLASDLPAVYTLDRQEFGADRSSFLAYRLQNYPGLCKVMVDGEHICGFILGRRGEGWIAAGPWVVSNRALQPEFMLESLACEASHLPLALGILECNRRGVEMFLSLGFEARPEPPWRMALGPCENLGASAACLAIGSPAKG
jgi:ribosomal protein S18 acetylase RimI-like enzyme